MNNNNNKDSNYYLYVIALIILAGAVAFIYFKYYKDSVKTNNIGDYRLDTYEKEKI